MKKLYPIIVFILSWLPAFTQTVPDTLIIETPKKQKIILIADDVNSFRNIKSDSLINAALRKVKDSLTALSRPLRPDLRLLTKEQRSAYLKRRDDSLQAIDGLTAKERYKKNREELHSDKSRYLKNIKGNSPFGIKLNTGAGLVRNKISPVFEAGVSFAPQKQDYYSLGPWPSYTFMNITANRYYTFEQNVDASFTTFNNTFINFSIGNRNNTRLKSNFLVSEFEIGAGYQIEREGSYFGKNTFKLFGSIVTRSKFIRLTPELYITDNFKELFPGFTVKFF